MGIRRSFSAVLATVAVASIAMPATAASSIDPATKPATDDLTTPIVARGTTNGDDEATARSGATVEILAMPPMEARRLGKGESYQLTSISHAVTDSSGRFTARLDEGVNLTRTATAKDEWT